MNIEKNESLKTFENTTWSKVQIKEVVGQNTNNEGKVEPEPQLA